MTNLPKHKKKSKPKNKSKAEKLFENAIQIARDVITNGDHVPRSTSRKKSKPVPYGISNEADEEHGGSGDEYEDNEEEGYSDNDNVHQSFKHPLDPDDNKNNEKLVTFEGVYTTAVGKAFLYLYYKECTYRCINQHLINIFIM